MEISNINIKWCMSILVSHELVTRQYLGIISISMLLAVLYLSKLNYTTVKNRCGHYINSTCNIKDGDYIFVKK